MTQFDPGKIFATLDRHGVSYLTIGAWAVIAHGYVRATSDIDFIARQDRENIVRLASALKEMNARLRRVDADKLDIDPTDPTTLGNGASFTMDTDFGPLDFLNDVPGADDFDAMLGRGHRATAGEIGVWVVGYEDLVRMKRASGREQDLLDIHELARILEGEGEAPRDEPRAEEP